ncbi:MAG: carbohydrate ABC transporter permease [Eubacteriales bacterium]|nr:carbohydrate ABC transporter permease [bacterium]MDY2792857.1 carbohydrate ABC transporter permease [Eubacteriales bacterium]
MARRNSIHLCRQDRILNVFLYVFLAIFLILCAYPVYFVLIASFSNATVVNSGKLMLWPEGFHLLGYKFVFSDVRILIGYKNTLIYTIGGTVLGLFVSLLAGYSLSRSDLPGRKVLMALMVFTMYFGGGLIPTYITIKNMGLVDTRALMIILGSVSVYNIILIRTFFQSNLPTELQEAAFIDGCTNTRFFFQFALPLSSAIIAVIALYLAVGYWNSYFNALIYINSNAKKPLTLFIRELLLSQETNDVADGELASDFKRMAQVVKYAVIVVATAPIMCMYPFLQKYFVKGVMIGSLKG